VDVGGSSRILKLSFHYGLNTVDPNKYDGWKGPLRTCRNDAIALASLFKTLGFVAAIRIDSEEKEQNVAAERLPTLAQFEADLTMAAEMTAPGDTVYISFSGHGGRIEDKNAPSGYTYFLCFYDGKLLDTDFFKLMTLFSRGVKVVVDLDSCNSGGMGENYKFLHPS
jgi:metacaspase-1